MSRRYYEDEDDEDLRPKRRSDYQMEIGTGGILGAFAVIAILCGLFYAFGFTIGKHAVPATFSLGDNSASAPVQSSPVNKPEAGTPIQNPATADNGAQPPNPNDLTAAEVNQTPQTLMPGPAGATATPPDSSQPAGTSAPATGNSVAQAATMQPTSASRQQPVSQPPATLPLAPTQAATPQSSWAVQVFAGSREGDALSLAAALKARQFPVFILKPNSSSDGLYHVQVGPYSDHTQAEQMRARLAADGYNAVIE